MPDLTTIGLFALAAFTLSLIPGPDMIYVATRSVSQGRGAGLASLLGIYTGDLVHAFAAILGLSALIAASASALSIVKYVGAAYLVYLGIQTLLSKEETLLVQDKEPAKFREIFYQGLVVNVLNPKIILFFLAFLPQFLDPAKGSLTLQIVFFSFLLIVVTLPVNLAVGLAGGLLGTWLRAKQGVQKASKWVAGCIYIVLGAVTAFTGLKEAK